MENEQTQKYQNFVSAQNSLEDPSKYQNQNFIPQKYNEHTYHFAMEIQPPGGNINYSIHMQKLCFVYDEKAVPASRSKVQEDKRKWNLPHSRERLSFIIERNH